MGNLNKTIEPGQYFTTFVNLDFIARWCFQSISIDCLIKRVAYFLTILNI